MTRATRRIFLVAEKALLERLLATLHENSVLERMGLESRLHEVSAELASLQAGSGPTAESELILYGTPVRESAGSDARFTRNVISAYQDLIAKTLAARNEQHAIAPVPDAHLSRLHVTEIFHGSSGLHFQERPERESLGKTPLFEATEEAARLIDAAGKAKEDEAFVDLVEDLDPRVHAALRGFFTTIADTGGTFRLSTATTISELTTERLRAAVDQVTIERREDPDHPLSGVFMGVLHASRQFEHQLDNGDVIHGRADPTLDLSTLVHWSLKPCIAHVRVVRWTRSGREHERFMLRRLERTRSPGSANI
jgi:hypothetical protein